MKSQFLITVLMFTATTVFAQGDRTDNARVVGSTFINPYKKKDKPLGSPYSQQMFSAAKVTNINVNAYMRYNAFKDEFEFITPKNDTLILDKTEDFGNIVFKEHDRKYQLVAYSDTQKKLAYGYLINQYEKAGFVLFQKENIGFTEAKFAKTSLERDMPAKFSPLSNDYFLKNNDKEISEFPNGKKALVKLFPEKKQVIETFIKENKISFDNEKDLIKIIDFLATN